MKAFNAPTLVKPPPSARAPAPQISTLFSAPFKSLANAASSAVTSATQAARSSMGTPPPASTTSTQANRSAMNAAPTPPKTTASTQASAQNATAANNAASKLESGAATLAGAAGRNPKLASKLNAIASAMKTKAGKMRALGQARSQM